MDDPTRSLDEEAARSGREVQEAHRAALVTLQPKDARWTAEVGTVQHEPYDRARRVELAEAVTVDVIDVGLVQAAENVGVELAEWHGQQRVQDVHHDARRRPEPV